MVDINIVRSTVENCSINFMEAWKKKDFDYLNRILSNDFQFINTHVKGHRYNKSQWLDVARNKYELLYYRYEFLHLTQNDCLAVNLSRILILSSQSLSDQPNKYLLTDVWKRENEEWKLLLRQPVLL